MVIGSSGRDGNKREKK